MNVVKKTIKEALALLVIASILGFVGNEMKGDARIEPFRNYFAKRVPKKPVASEADDIGMAGEASLQESPIASDSPETPESGYQEISFDALADLYQEGPVEAGIVVLVDARGDESFAEGHIPGALQCDHYKLERHIYGVLDAIKASDKVVVYCNGGKCEDSIFVCGDLMDFGVPYDKIYLFKGGWEEWTKNNMPVEGGGVN